MINYDLIFVLLSIVGGCGLTLLIFIRKEERSKQLDLWLGMALFFLLGYKLLPILDSPSMLLKPVQLLILKSGDLGLLLGFILSCLYWIYIQIKWKIHFVDSLSKLIIALVSSYTIMSLIQLEVYKGQYLGLYRVIVGALFLLLVKYKPQLLHFTLILYGGVLLVIESLSFAHLYFGFSLIQWLILFVVFTYMLLYMLQRKGRSDWLEK